MYDYYLSFVHTAKIILFFVSFVDVFDRMISFFSDRTMPRFQFTFTFKICTSMSTISPKPSGQQIMFVEFMQNVFLYFVSKFRMSVKNFLTGFDHEYELDVIPGGLTPVFVVNADYVNRSIVVSAEIKLCVDLFMTCSPSIELFHKIPFVPNSVRLKRGTLL